MTEKWSPAFGYEDRYEASSMGRIRNAKTGNIRQCRTNPGGYVTACMWREKKDTVRVHRIIASTFIRPPLHDEQVNHIDGIKTNNCVNNLEWCTPKENTTHSIGAGLFAPRKLSSTDIEKIKKRVKSGEKQIDVARDYAVTPTCISMLVRGLTYGGAGYIPSHFRHGKGRRRDTLERAHAA